METEFKIRIIENKDWATALFIIAACFIVTIKTFFENRFLEFIKLPVSDKYLKTYKDGTHLKSWFSIVLFFVQMITFAFLLLLFLDAEGLVDKYNWQKYILIFTLLITFVLSKFLIEKIIATSFYIEELIEQFNLQKVTYRTMISIFLFPAVVFLYYNPVKSTLVYYTIFSMLLIYNSIVYIKIIRQYQNIVIGKLFYFILYLCTLEIAPYYFLYYWFTRS